MLPTSRASTGGLGKAAPVPSPGVDVQHLTSADRLARVGDADDVAVAAGGHQWRAQPVLDQAALARGQLFCVQQADAGLRPRRAEVQVHRRVML